MTNQNIKQLETELWDAADDLRANSKLTAVEHKDSLLGLVLLRFDPRTGEKREVNRNDYTSAGANELPEKAKYGYLIAFPEVENIAEAINNANGRYHRLSM